MCTWCIWTIKPSLLSSGRSVVTKTHVFSTFLHRRATLQHRVREGSRRGQGEVGEGSRGGQGCLGCPRATQFKIRPKTYNGRPVFTKTAIFLTFWHFSKHHEAIWIIKSSLLSSGRSVVAKTHEAQVLQQAFRYDQNTCFLYTFPIRQCTIRQCIMHYALSPGLAECAERLNKNQLGRAFKIWDTGRHVQFRRFQSTFPCSGHHSRQ